MFEFFFKWKRFIADSFNAKNSFFDFIRLLVDSSVFSFSSIQKPNSWLTSHLFKNGKVFLLVTSIEIETLTHIPIRQILVFNYSNNLFSSHLTHKKISMKNFVQQNWWPKNLNNRKNSTFILIEWKTILVLLFFFHCFVQFAKSEWTRSCVLWEKCLPFRNGNDWCQLSDIFEMSQFSFEKLSSLQRGHRHFSVLHNVTLIHHHNFWRSKPFQNALWITFQTIINETAPQ